jgi:hypothetical protein
MICNELVNGQYGRSNRNRAQEHIDLDRYHRLPLVTRKLISGWFTLASKRLENDEDNCFEAFIFAWIAFNGWASCISGIDLDKDMILALKKYEPISTKFEELFDTDACFRSYATLFSQFWPIFEVKSTRHVHYEGDDDREKIIKIYFDSDATVYSPQCWKRHKTQDSKIPVDWPHMLDALYRVRCNLFHGEKALSSENDKRIVSYAAHTLVHFLRGSNYLEL